MPWMWLTRVRGLVQLDRTGLTALPSPPFRPDATGTLSDTLPAFVPVVDLSTLTLTLNPGTGALPAIIATIRYNGAPVPATYSDLRPFLEAAIRASDPNQPLLTGVVVQLVGNRFRVLLGRSGTGFQAAATLAFTGATADTLQLSTAQGATVGPQQVALVGGADSGVLTETVLRGVRSAKTGLFALEDADLFNILSVPAAAALPTVNDMRAFYAAATAYCEERRSFLIVDIAETVNTLDDMQTWLIDNATLRHRNAAVYFPRVRIADSLQQYTSGCHSFGLSSTSR